MVANKISDGFDYLREFSAFLLAGTVLALIWANAGPGSYAGFVDEPLITGETLSNWAASGGLAAIAAEVYRWIAGLFTHGHPDHFTFHFVINDMFMVFFFGLAAKEVSESFLPGGALSSVKKASMPAVATLGGVVGPISLFFILFYALQLDASVANAWAVPAATDIAYCWLFARLIFGNEHPAVTFLLVLAVLDDLIGMLIIATYYTPEVHLPWLGLLALALVICEVMRRAGVNSYWPYIIIGGTLSWFGLHNTGVHASLALVPIVPFMPHAERDRGLFVESNYDHDTMNRFEHAFAPFVDVGLFGFGLANAGVALTADSLTGGATWTIFLALLVGKTFGIFGFAWVGERFGLTLPKPMTMSQVTVLGCVAGIGFTVALFVTAVAMETAPIPEPVGDMLKLGALLSFVAGPIAWGLARIFDVERIDEPMTDGETTPHSETSHSPA